MNIRSLPAVLTAVALLPLAALAQNATTVPVGVMTITINGSLNGTSLLTTAFSAPLLESEGVTGQARGRITGVGSNTLSNANAGWTAGALAVQGSPYFIHITSGANAGRLFQITANTATQLTVNSQSLDLISLNFVVGANGDTYEIVMGTTLLSLVGAPSPSNPVKGGTLEDCLAFRTDRIIFNDPDTNIGGTYYYNTASGQFRRVGSNANRNNIVISPRQGIYYQRIETSPLTFTFTGAVPAVGSVTQVANSGTTLLASYFPTDRTLDQLAFQNLPGWRKVNQNGITVNDCDRVILPAGAGFFTYHFDHILNQWRRPGSSVNQGGIGRLPAGSAAGVVRLGISPGAAPYAAGLPYNLN